MAQKLREALSAKADKSDKQPLELGVLSVTPDPPEVAEWRNKSFLDTVAADSGFLEEADGEGVVAGGRGRTAAAGCDAQRCDVDPGAWLLTSPDQCWPRL